MKPSGRHTVLATLLVALPLLQAASDDDRTPARCCTAAPCGLQAPLTDDARPVCDPETLAALRAQYAEERMAARVYRTLAEQYPQLRPLQNIPLAEDRHAGSVATLLAAADPAFSLSAMIKDPQYSTLGDDLIARGRVSEIEALRVGAWIEEKDILDLRALAARLEHAGARAIVDQLERGSHHHLTAFVRNLRRRGVTYEPQLLSADDFGAILSDNG